MLRKNGLGPQPKRRPRGRIDSGRLLKLIDQLEVLERLDAGCSLPGQAAGISSGLAGARTRHEKAGSFAGQVLSRKNVSSNVRRKPAFPRAIAPARAHRPRGSSCFLAGHLEYGEHWSGPFLDSPIKKYARNLHRDRFFQTR